MVCQKRYRTLRAWVAGAFLASMCAMPSAFAQQVPLTAAANANPVWVTLGTVGGPMAQKDRGEPANLLLVKGVAYLVDAGDGAASRLLNAGVNMASLRGIFISHLHFDHIGGLFGVLGLRLQMRMTTPLTIYGPPGTKVIVAGLVKAMGPSAESGFGVPGEIPIAPDLNLSVVELVDGATINVTDIMVRAVANTHYSFPAGSEASKRFQSLSFRFDLPGHSLVYTGDTGPSSAVERLATGADTLVTEMIDLESTMARMQKRAREISAVEAKQMEEHLQTHHLKTSDIAAMATRAGVKRVIVTHIGGAGAAAGGTIYAEQIKRGFSGDVKIASDGDHFDF